MTDSPPDNSFAAQLLQQDHSVPETAYQEYRMKLEHALTVAERRQKLAYWIAMVTGPIALVLMFVGGSGVAGAFDPTDRDANGLSVTLAVIYWICAILCPLSIAAYYSRFRPAVRDVKDQLRDVSLQSLHHEIAKLQQQVETLQKGRDSV